MISDIISAKTVHCQASCISASIN